MSYQYLFCATCGQRRTGHSFTCSVCGGTMRHAQPQQPTSVLRLQPIVRAPEAPAEVRQPIAA
jgi:hypothetical protein